MKYRIKLQFWKLLVKNDWNSVLKFTETFWKPEVTRKTGFEEEQHI